MQENASVHKSPTPVRHSRIIQARSEKKEKREEDRQERQRFRRLMERKADQENKNTSEKLKQGLLGTAQVNKAEG